MPRGLIEKGRGGGRVSMFPHDATDCLKCIFSTPGATPRDFGGGLGLSSPIPDPISDQNMPGFFRFSVTHSDTNPLPGQCLTHAPVISHQPGSGCHMLYVSTQLSVHLISEVLFWVLCHEWEAVGGGGVERRDVIICKSSL